MSDSKSKSISSGLCDVLLVVFIVLKLLGVVTWSWVWVLAPLWIPHCIVIVMTIIPAILISLEALQRKKRRDRGDIL